MHWKTLTLVSCAALAMAVKDVGDLVSRLPACSTGCFSQAAIAVDCDAGDLVCRCQKKRQISALVRSCLKQSCSDDQITTVSSVSDQICKALGNVRVASTTGTSAGAIAKTTPPSLVASGGSSTTTASSIVTTASSIGSSIQPVPPPTQGPLPVTTAAASANGVPAGVLVGMVALGFMVL